MGIVEQYLLQLKTEKRRWRCAAAVLTALSLLVVAGVSWNLRMTGVAIANDACCGQPEHRHTEECPVEKVLKCEYYTSNPADELSGEPAENSAVTEKAPGEETVPDTPADLGVDAGAAGTPAEYAGEPPEGIQTDSPPPEHIHSDACYETVRLCGLEEHIHVPSCYSDPAADLETPEIWEASLPALTAEWADDMAQIARSQLGCGESERNFIVADDGATQNGITRYGQWYGNPHGDWSAMFIMFCLHYAEIPEESIPRSPGVYNMMRLAEDSGICSSPDENTGAVGNIVFLDADLNGAADRALIVVTGAEGSYTAIGGDLDNSVKEITLSADDGSVLGYIHVRAFQHPPPDAPESEEDPDKDAEVPVFEETPALLMNAVVRAPTDSAGAHLTTVAGNLWQIVEGGYEGREEANKQDCGDVHIQKNLVPTDVENEFLVYLSISKQLSWKTVLDYGSYFASSANGSVGDTVSITQGNPQALSVIQTGTHKTPFYMVIQIWDDSKTQMKSETDILVRYTNKGMKNGKILLQIPGTEQAIVVANVKNYAGTTADNPVYVELTESQLGGGGGGEGTFESFSVVDTVLDTVVDEMGDNIEFIEVVAGDYLSTPTFSNGALTWYPKTAAIEAGQGTGQLWQNNAAQLVYRVRLKNDRSCGACLDTVCSVGGCDHVYPANKSAVLTYHKSDAPGTFYTAEFQVPYVRGLLYDIHFIKINQDTELPLRGAVFRLTGKEDASFLQTATSGISGREGEVSFTDLRAGTYVLTELEAPSGYEITFGDANHSMEVVLSLTSAPNKVQKDAFDPLHAANLMYKGTENGDWKISNRYMNVDPVLPATGGRGILLYWIFGLILVAAPFVYIFYSGRGRVRRSRK